MKKSKFLLLGSVASLASIPFVAAKCGETKEEKKPEEGKNPDQNTEPGKNPSENTGPGKNPSENTEPGKNPDQNTEPGKNPGGNTEPGKNPGEEMNPGNNMTPGSNSENGNNQNTPIKKSLPAIISNSNQQLGEINKNDGQSILGALLEKNRSLNLDKSQLDVKNIKTASAIVFAKKNSTKYEGQILVSFRVKNHNSESTVTKQKLEDALKSISGKNLGKVQVSKETEKKDKAKIEASIKETIILKVPALAGKDLQFKTDLTKNEVNVSSNDFQGEVVLKFEVEVKSSEKQKLEDALKSISGKNLGKVQVSKETEKKDKAKIEASIKETIILKVPALAGKDLQFKTDLTKNEVNVSSNDFQGEVVLKFEVEVKSSEKQKLEDALKSISGKNLGKVQVSKETEKKDKAKIEASIKETIILKVPALAGKDLQFKTDLTKNEVNVSSNDFQGEVVLKFEVEVKSK
ncbi:variable surface lipoprotein [Mycoplasmopsis bovis]|uniref:variable surface lipoprotein n=1 Tax=Mycoplasmopsis bovis TaxID=28903 RepID=UPI003D038652